MNVKKMLCGLENIIYIRLYLGFDFQTKNKLNYSMLSISVSTIGDIVPFHYTETNNEKNTRNRMPQLETRSHYFYTTCMTSGKFLPLASLISSYAEGLKILALSILSPLPFRIIVRIK